MKNTLLKNKGYALISQKYLKGERENYHILPAYLTNKYINNNRISIKIRNNKCKKRPFPQLYNFEKLYHRTIFFIDMNDLRTIKLKGGKHDYYVGYNNVYYFEDKITAKIVIASFTSKEVCGSCMSMLYGSKDN